MTGSRARALVDGWRGEEAVRSLAADIERLNPGRTVRLMHVCGTHENALCQFGLRDLLPPWVKLVAGPGCPVCVCPAADIDQAVRLSLEHPVTVATFGDVVRVPARRSLLEAKARGGDVRVVYGIDDAIALAQREPKREVVFFAVGFETTACTTAAALRRETPPNFSVLCSHRLVPPALEALLEMDGAALDGFVLPGHVMAVAGLVDYEPIAARRGAPMAVAGFEPVDLLLAIRHLVERAIRRSPGEPESIFNAYARLVRREGNPAAREAMAAVFEPFDASWRGVGKISASGARLREAFAAKDAGHRFGISPDPKIPDTHPACKCGEVLLGRFEPEECPLFGRACKPESPIGACMVAFEGTCHARWRHGRRAASRSGAA